MFRRPRKFAMTKKHACHYLVERLGLPLWVILALTVFTLLLKTSIRETFKPLTKDANYQMRDAFVKMLGNADEMVTGIALDISDETRERKFLSFKSLCCL